MFTRSELTEKILEKAKSLGASIAGVASVESLKTSPSHKIYPKIGMNLNDHFTDIKNGTHKADVFWPEDAVSVVVIGVEHNADEPELDWWDGKGTPGNRTLIKINNQMSEWIENILHIKTFKLPYFIEKGGLFLKDAAVYAGLGCIGKNNLVITPEHGPRIRFRALMLNKKVKSTAFHPEFNPCKNCGQPCRKSCPMNAFQNKVYSSETFGQSILPGTNGTYDRVACNIKMEKDIDDAAMMMTQNDKEQQKIGQLIKEFEKRHIKEPTINQMFSYCVKYCRKCELSCPVGIKK